MRNNEYTYILYTYVIMFYYNSTIVIDNEFYKLIFNEKRRAVISTILSYQYCEIKYLQEISDCKTKWI